jgi:CBS domain-containing protein
MKIQEILGAKGGNVITIHADKTVHDAVKILVKHNIGSLLVLGAEEKPVGIITERDILRECAERDNKLRTTKVKDVMTKDLIIGVPDDDLDYTMGIMTKNHIRHLPIMQHHKVVGMISIGDLVKAQLDEQEYTNRYLKQYMFGR